MNLVVNRLFMAFAFLLIHISTSFGQELAPANNMEEYQKLYDYRIRQSHLNGTYIPEGLTDAFVQLNKLIAEADRKQLATYPEELVARNLEGTLGRWIVYNWGFEGGSRMSHFLKNIGLTHPNDMATFIIVTYHRTLNDQPLDVKPLVTTLIDKRKEIALSKNPAKKAIVEHNREVLSEKNN